MKDVAPRTAIVALTRHDDEAYVQELFAAGALAYVLKQESLDGALFAPCARRRQAISTSTPRSRHGSGDADGARPARPGRSITDREARCCS
jgi:DNA-binding NarL/FixJ family response regulator